MKTFLVLRRRGWAAGPELEAAAERSKVAGAQMAADVRWIRTYAVAEEDGTLGAVCVYQGTSEDKVREHAACADLPIDEIIPIADTLVINPDPE